MEYEFAKPFPTCHSVAAGSKSVPLDCESGDPAPVSGAGKLTYCAFFDKSTKFSTEVVLPIISKFGYWAKAEQPPGDRGGHFPKWPPRHVFRYVA